MPQDGAPQLHHWTGMKLVENGPSMFQAANSLVVTNVCREKGLLLSIVCKLVRWPASAVSFTLSDIILAQLAYPLSDIMFCLHSGITSLSLSASTVALSL
jgi:hypothetical protein